VIAFAVTLVLVIVFGLSLASITDSVTSGTAF